jgi:formylglycine-generating enzyme required for sulfatase activity
LFPWGGDTISHSQANYYSMNSYSYDISPTRDFHPAYTNEGTPYTSPMGSFPANGYGLHDMAGNVWEWCWDWYGDYSATYQTDPRGPTSGSFRVWRGGSWNNSAHEARCANRFYEDWWPSFEQSDKGFRCVRVWL